MTKKFSLGVVINDLKKMLICVENEDDIDTTSLAILDILEVLEKRVERLEKERKHE